MNSENFNCVHKTGIIFSTAVNAISHARELTVDLAGQTVASVINISLHLCHRMLSQSNYSLLNAFGRSVLILLLKVALVGVHFEFATALQL